MKTLKVQGAPPEAGKLAGSLALEATSKELRDALAKDDLCSGALLLSLKRGSCWCEMGIGNPMVTSHSQACQDVARHLSKCPCCGGALGDTRGQVCRQCMSDACEAQERGLAEP